MYIFCGSGLASCRWRQLTSNVRPHKHTMTPSLPVPTDNIYKFACLFGLVLIVAGIFSFVAVYSSSLESKVKYKEAIIGLESKATREKAEEERLKLNQTLLDITGKNEEAAQRAISVVLAAGILLASYGAWKWKTVVQPKDDRVAQLQVEKLELEVAKLATGNKPAVGVS